MGKKSDCIKINNIPNPYAALIAKTPFADNQHYKELLEQLLHQQKNRVKDDE